MLTVADIDKLLSSRVHEEEATRLLAELTPELSNGELFDALISRLQSTAKADFVEALRPFSAQAIDCCGTGGSGQVRFNTSTAVAFVLAAAGLKVAKFGNRAASGRSGSFDVLEQLGIPASTTPAQAAFLLDKCGVVFLFAPDVYPALSRLAPLRQQVGKRTLLNFVGPLLNPALPAYRLMGTSDLRMHEPMVRAAVNSSAREVVVATAACGLDEICPGCTPALTCSGHRAAGMTGADETPALPGSCRGAAGMITPGSAGILPAHGAAHIPGSAGTAETNAKALVEIFDGADTTSPAYHLVVTNAAAALVLTGTCDSLPSARDHVAALLASQAVKQTFRQTVELYEALS